MSLPGLVPQTAAGEADDEIRVRFGRYEEGERELYGVESAFDPIRVDTLGAGFGAQLSDRLRLSVDYLQDTWSGATPISTAPRALGGNRPTSPDGVSGATPYVNGQLFFDGDFNVLETDGFGNVTGTIDDQLVHTLSSASPETRNRVDLGLGWDGDDVAVTLGGGFSLEDDYESGFVELGGRWDLHQRRTMVTGSASYAHSGIGARLDHDAFSYFDTSHFDDRIDDRTSGSPVLRDTRDDWAIGASVSRVLSRNALLELHTGFTRSTGYLENPYKVVQVAFLDPDQQFLAPPGGFFGDVQALMEQRPDRRNLWNVGARLVHYVEPLDAGARLEYRFDIDDWGIQAHTMEASFSQPLGDSWLWTPHVRYYSQTAADFYTPYLISDQAYQTIVSDTNGNIVSITPFDPGLLPGNFSSDHRLSAFGALAAGFGLSKQLPWGIRLDVGFDYYLHRGRWVLGGEGEGAYADFDGWTASAGVTLDLRSLTERRPAPHGIALAHAVHGDGGGASHAGHGIAPAGLMFAHMPDQAGDFMLGYRYTFMRRAGDMLSGSDSGALGDAFLVSNACGEELCSNTPKDMHTHVHMLDLMWAPTDWLSLLVMPTFVDKRMTLRELEGGPFDVHSNHQHHSTGGFGDTRLGALVRLLDVAGHRVQLGAVISAPSGAVDEEFRRSHQEPRGFTHYGMQLGSGTWDALPSLTWQGSWRRARFGAQLLGVVRMQSEGPTGFAFGDGLQASLWGGYAFRPWLGATLRAVYSQQGPIRGQYDGLASDTTPPDVPDNYGGRFWDLGIGASVTVPRGIFAGQRIALEWLQPLADDYEGVQLERVGTLHASWSMHF